MKNQLIRVLGSLNKWLLIALTLVLVLPSRLPPIVLSIWMSVALISGIASRHHPTRKEWLHLLVLVFPFVLLTGSMLYSENRVAGWFEVEKSMAFLAIPLGFIFFPKVISQRFMHILFRVFILFCNGLILYGSFRIMAHGINYEFGDLAHRIRIDFSNYTGTHATYASLFFLFALLLKLELMFHYWHQQKPAAKWFDVLQILFFLGFVFLLASRMPFFAFVPSLLIYLLVRLKKPLRTLGIATVLLVVGVMFLQLVPSVMNRLNELNPANLAPPVGNNINSVNTRAGIFLCGQQLLEDHWLVGLGVGDVQDAFNQCYKQFDTPVYVNHPYDAHNQYVHFWLAGGLPLLLAFLASLFIPTYLAVRRKQPLYLAFLILVALCFLTETILSRQFGVVFYTFFQALFLFHSPVAEQDESSQ